MAAEPQVPNTSIVDFMTRRDVMIALSLANLMYLDVWVEFLSPLRESDRSFRSAPGAQDFAAVMINVLLLTLLFVVAVAVVRRIAPSSGMRLIRWAFQIGRASCRERV